MSEKTAHELTFRRMLFRYLVSMVLMLAAFLSVVHLATNHQKVATILAVTGTVLGLLVWDSFVWPSFEEERPFWIRGEGGGPPFQAVYLLASLMSDEETYSEFVVPTLRDLELEYFKSWQRNQIVKAKWIRALGSVSLVCQMIVRTLVVRVRVLLRQPRD